MVRRPLSPHEIDAIRMAARRDDVLRAMATFYAHLDAAVAQHQPVCVLRGACCRFDEYGHNLFVTTLEAAYFVAHAGQPHAAVVDGCPYQIEGRCRARDARPMGCRIFFCDPQTRHWQGPLTEEALRCLRLLHEKLVVSYVYAEWRNVLTSLEL
jgi:Fe-S-cluster containining protein